MPENNYYANMRRDIVSYLEKNNVDYRDVECDEELNSHDIIDRSTIRFNITTKTEEEEITTTEDEYQSEEV